MKRNFVPTIIFAASIMLTTASCSERLDTQVEPEPGKSPVANEMPSKQRLPNNLGPKAKRAFLRPSQDNVLCMLQISPKVDVDHLTQQIQDLGARVGTHSKETNTLNIETTGSLLTEIAGLEGVTYVELAQSYSR